MSEAGLHQPLALHHPLAGGVVAALGQMVLEDGGGGLLDLEEQGVGAVAALQEHHPRSGADAADSDHLACHVDDGESVQHLPAVVAEGGLIEPELLLDRVPSLLGCHLVARR
jgi:hypothetical protein